MGDMVGSSSLSKPYRRIKGKKVYAEKVMLGEPDSFNKLYKYVYPEKKKKR